MISYKDAIPFAALLLSLLSGKVHGVGRVPDGGHTSEAFGMESIEIAIELCDETVSCAGLTYRPSQDKDDPQPDIHYHVFLPPLLDVPDDPSWTTHRSNKTFVFHPGKVITKNANDILNLDVDPATTSLSEARELCKEHSECVAFTYPTHSTKLAGFENITFVGSIESFSHLEGDYWRTLVVNDASKASRINPDAMFYDEEREKKPYSSCCDRAVLNKTTETPIIPTIEDLERMDTLPRIPCSISKEDFQAKYELTRTPVMLVGCDEDWPAKEKWTVKNLIHRFDNSTQWRAKTSLDKETMGEYDEDVEWKIVAEELEKNEWFYIFDDLDRPGRESLKAEYSIPSPFQGTDLYAEDFPPDLGTLRWFCLGSKHTGTMVHMDPFGSDAWNSLVVGHKWWMLFPPDATKRWTHECDEKCSPEDPFPIDWYASIAINAARTPYGNSGSTPMHVLQKPGETIYVPYEALHSVFNMDESIAITANFGSPGNLLLVWENVLREGTEEQWKEMYYKRFTDEQRKAVREGGIWPPAGFRR